MAHSDGSWSHKDRAAADHSERCSYAAFNERTTASSSLKSRAFSRVAAPSGSSRPAAARRRASRPSLPRATLSRAVRRLRRLRARRDANRAVPEPSCSSAATASRERRPDESWRGAAPSRPPRGLAPMRRIPLVAEGGGRRGHTALTRDPRAVATATPADARPDDLGRRVGVQPRRGGAEEGRERRAQTPHRRPPRRAARRRVHAAEVRHDDACRARRPALDNDRLASPLPRVSSTGPLRLRAPRSIVTRWMFDAPSAASRAYMERRRREMALPAHFVSVHIRWGDKVRRRRRGPDLRLGRSLRVPCSRSGAPLSPQGSKTNDC